MLKVKNLFFLAVSVILLMACENKPYDPVASLPESSGEMGELVVVVEKEYWSSSVMQAINEIFGKEILSLPQPEPLMSIKPVTEKGFSGGPLKHHSILILDIGSLPSGSQAYIGNPRTNVWANGQLVYTLKSPDLATATALIKEQGNTLLGYYQEHYKSKINLEIKQQRSQEINDELALTMGVNMDVPSTFTLVANYNDFVWLKQQRQKFADGQDHEIQLGIMVYTYAYTDSLAFTMEKILNKRDSLTKKYVPGMIEGSYMKTERQYGLESKEGHAQGHFLVETRGVWKMHNAIMGGPFLSLTVYDAEKDRIVCLEGYVFAPHFRKMPYIRELEAMLYSFQFVDNQQE